MNIKTVLKSSVAAAALFAVAAPMPAQADEGVKSGKKQTSLTVSGYVAAAIVYADDGTSDEVSLTDGRNVGTRVRWIVKGSLTENVTAGATIEINLPNNVSGAKIELGGLNTDNNTTAVTRNTGWGVRQQYVWVQHKKMGKIFLGHTDTASNSATEGTFSGTGIFQGSQMGGTSFGSGIEFVETTAGVGDGAGTPNKSVSAINPGAIFSNFDGLSRRQTLRYDTPRFMGLLLKTSVAQRGAWDVAFNYNAKYGPVKVLARGYYANVSVDSASTGFNAGGSVAALHDSGLNASFALGKAGFSGAGKFNCVSIITSSCATPPNDLKGHQSPTMYYFSVGYRAKIFGTGETAFNIEYHQTDDLLQTAGFDDSEAEAFALTALQNFNAIGAQVGIRYQNMSFDAKNNATARSFDDIDTFALLTVFNF